MLTVCFCGFSTETRTWFQEGEVAFEYFKNVVFFSAVSATNYTPFTCTVLGWRQNSETENQGK